MPSRKNEDIQGLIAFLALTDLFQSGKKTKDTNEEIYHDANFPDPVQLKMPDGWAGGKQKSDNAGN